MSSSSSSATPSWARALGKAQAAGGALLGVWLVFHLWQQWPALTGREAWVDRAVHTTSSLGGVALLVAALLGHGLAGLYRMRTQPHPAAQEQSPGLRRVQAVLGVLVLGFVAVHVAQVLPASGPHASVRDVYERLERSLGTPPLLALYLVGVTASAAHLGLGLTRAAFTWSLPLDARARNFGAALLAGAVWLAWLQVLACFAIGEPLFVLPTSAP